MLTSFTLEQLQLQLAGLQELVKESASHLEQVRMLERQQRALQKQRQYDAKRKACMLHQKAPNAASSLPGDDSSDTGKGVTGGDSLNTSGDCNSVSVDDVASAGAGTSAEQTAEELSIGAQLGKTRRRTLRKQIERLQARIAVLTASAPAASSSVSANSVNQLKGESTAVPTSGTTAESTACTAAPVAATSVTDGEVQYNPKTRGGWGFWKT